MHYTIYKITNKLDGKIYIGKHQTKDLSDNYMGSGKILKRAIDMHGLENFTKEILFQFDNEADMNAKEAELVTEEFVKEDTNYNLCPGGDGGWGYINSNDIPKFKGKRHSTKSKKLIAAAKIGNSHNLGRETSKEAKEKLGKIMSQKLKGKTKSDEHKKKIAESVRKRHAERKAELAYWLCPSLPS